MSDPARVVVAEDEPAARRHVVRLIARDRRFVVVGEATSGAEAVDLARTAVPDVLFLDVQMPGADGFDVVRALDGPAMPLVVFVTAFDTYAIRAFDVHAVDYLLKPFEDARLARTLDVVAGHLDGRALSRMRQQLGSLVRGRAPAHRPAPSVARLTIRTASGIVFVPVSTITHLAADDYCAFIHTARKTHHVRETLTSLGARLPRHFARVHRSTIVNLAAVQSIEPLTHGEARVRLADGIAVKVSRSYRSALAPLLDESTPLS